MSGPELKDALLRSGRQVFTALPLGNENESADQFIDKLFSRREIVFAVSHKPSFASGFRSDTRTSHGLLHDHQGYSISNLEVKFDGAAHSIEQNIGPADTLTEILFWIWINDSFFFNAERFNVSRCAHSHSVRLTPDASNLPAVLETLRGERGSVFDRIVEHMREIFPSFGNLSITPQRGAPGNVEILIWPTAAMDRYELGVSLSSSGTGVAQVLAILTAVLTVDRSVIIIDEINSFLHPAATKALLRILATYYQSHQYIISTHAPEVISFSDMRSLFVVKRDGYKSRVEKIDLQDRQNFREIADLLGVSMSDVFAADSIVWVEGPTEEMCFPAIYRHARGPLPRGLLMSSVAATGDFIFKKRDKELVYDIYKRLSEASASLTVSVSFSFDAEMLSDAEQKQMNKESKGLLRFLPRRHLECYFVDEGAIAAFINKHDTQRSSPVSQDDVQRSLIELANSAEFGDAVFQGKIDDEEWLKKVDAARLINACCNCLTESRVVFAKKADSLFLLAHILKHQPDKLASLCSYVGNLVP